jgi:RNA polymerase sigma-B factor
VVKEIAGGLRRNETAMSYTSSLPSQTSLSDRELAEQLASPETAEWAREALVRRYQPMVRALAHRYQLPAQHYEDLTQVGYVGLMKAINSFDAAIRPELKPYARACVDGEIKRYFRDKRWLIRVSRSDQELLLEAELGTTSTDEQVAARLDVTPDALRHAYQAHQAFAPGSLDAPVSPDDDRAIGELAGAEDPQFDVSDAMDGVRRLWAELPDLQRRILLLRFYGNMTQAQVAERLRCSQMHISRVQARALAFLRQRMQTE